MSAHLVKLVTRRQRLRAEHAAQLRQLVIEFQGLDTDAAGRIVAAIDRETVAGREWPFVMLSPAQNAFVVAQLTSHSERPKLAARLWAQLFMHLRLDTGEIVISRKLLAEELAAHPNHVSAVMGELARMNAVILRKEGREVRYFMNPLVATGVAGAVRDEVQARSPKLTTIDGGKAHGRLEPA